LLLLIIPINRFSIFNFETISTIASLITNALWGEGIYNTSNTKWSNCQSSLMKWIVTAKIPNEVIDIYIFIVNEILKVKSWR